MRQATHWPAVLAALAAGIVSGASISKMSPALPLLKAEFGLSLIATGWLVSMFNTIALASAIFFGLICDRAGALRFCLFGLACMIAGGSLGAFAPSAAWIIVSRIIEGAGYVAIMVAAPGLIAATSSPMQRGMALGLWGTHMPIGGAAVIAASPILIGSFGWRGVWVLVAAGAAVVTAVLALQSRHYAGMHRGTPRTLASVRGSLAQPVPWLLGIAFAVYTLQFYAVMIWLPTYLLQTRAADATTAALITALYVVSNTFGNLAGGWLMHRNVPRGVVIGMTFALTSAAFVGMFATGLSDSLRFACVVAYSVVTGTIPPAIFSGAIRYARSPAEAGTVQGLIVQLSNLGIFFGPPLIAAAVTAAGDWNAMLQVILPAAALGFAVSMVIARIESLRSRTRAAA